MSFSWTSSTHTFRQSARFCSPDADIEYQSSDGISFKIHSLYLKAHTECLAPPDGLDVAEIVGLPEDEETLEYLFQFVYPMPQPDLRSLNFGVVRKLAEAAEKYGVYPAKSRCHIMMQESVDQHPFPVLMFAMRHNYEDLMNRAALLHLKQPIEVAIQGMPEDCSVTWIRYHATWDFLRREFHAKFCNLPRGQFSDNDWQILRTLHSGTTWIGYLSLGPSGWPMELSDISERTRQIPTFSEFRKLTHAAPINPHILVPEQALVSEEPIKHFPNPFKDEPIILRSSDGRRFSVSPAILKASGDGFPTPTERQIEIILEEDNFTLDLLLQFVHNMAQPDLSYLNFERLEPLSTAAHKYRVHYATSAVKDRLRNFAQSDSVALLIHAFRIKDFELLDLASHYMLDLCPKEVVEKLPDDLIVIWTRYYSMWRRVADKVLDSLLALLPKSDSTSSWKTCNHCKQARICLSEMSEGVAGLRRLKARLELERKTDPFIFQDMSYTQHGVYRSCHSWLEPVYEASLDIRRIGHFSDVVRGYNLKGDLDLMPSTALYVLLNGVMSLGWLYLLFKGVRLLWALIGRVLSTL